MVMQQGAPDRDTHRAAMMAMSVSFASSSSSKALLIAWA